MGRRRVRFGRLSQGRFGATLLILGLAAVNPNHAEEAEAGTSPAQGQAHAISTNEYASAELPSLEMLLFLAEWSDEEQWIDPLALDQAMDESAIKAGAGVPKERPIRQRGERAHERS